MFIHEIRRKFTSFIFWNLSHISLWNMRAIKFSSNKREQQIKEHILFCQQPLKGRRTSKDLAKIMYKS